MSDKKESIKQIADNRSARHEYFIIERLEAGIELFGTEVKSIRAGNVNLKEAWVDIKGGEAFVVSMHVSPYEKGNIFNRDPLRRRRLLLHKREINKLYAEIKQSGLTLIPLSLYLKGSRVKVQVGLCKGKKLYDKRESIAKRDAERRTKRETGRNLK
ncbi:MAG: SsrA-binding protein SmpB [Oscillospiraceae bacterium]|nr:SsrA-binding protein SmpB [Oscillospiraceae bacterium]